MTEPASLGVITGLRFEAGIIERLSGDSGSAAPIVAAVGGRGDAARAEAGRMVRLGVRALISFGTAGALDPALDPGTLILPRLVKSADGRSFECDGDWSRRFEAVLSSATPCSHADLVSVEEPAFTVADKQHLARATQAGAVDMESFNVAEVAAEHHVPFLAIRAIADDAKSDLPPAARVAMADDGSIMIGKVLFALARRPTQLPALLRLARQNSEAAQTLDRCARSGLPLFALE